MRKIVRKISIHFLIAIIAIQILNLSIDAVEFQPIETVITINDFNYFNSMTEYITEIIIGDKDAFPEFQKESSSSKSQIVKHLSIKLSHQDTNSNIPSFTQESNAFIVPLGEDYKSCFLKEINPPPPKA